MAATVFREYDPERTILIPANAASEETFTDVRRNEMATGEIEEAVETEITDEEDQINQSNEVMKAARNEMNQRYNFRKSTVE